MKAICLAIIVCVTTNTSNPLTLGQELRTEAFEAIIKTIQWADKIKSYDVEFVIQRVQSIKDSETTFSSARIIREMCFDSSRFFINETQGMWYLSLGNRGQSDSMKSLFRLWFNRSIFRKVGRIHLPKQPRTIGSNKRKS